MSFLHAHGLDLLLVEEALWVIHATIGNPSYDFPLPQVFACRRPWDRSEPVTAVARLGAFADYSGTTSALAEEGISLIHREDQHRLAGELPEWYPHLVEMTPRSIWFDRPPSSREVEQHFSWPVFVKGSRQTHKHRSDLAIAPSASEFDTIMASYRADPILSWQRVVCREFVRLRQVPGDTGTKVPPAFEFRTFWWRGKLVGSGPYWAQFARYDWTAAEEREALALAERAAARVAVPFLVLDIAQAESGEWLVIECNDGQESGYAGVSPFTLWRNLIDEERKHRSTA